MIIDCPNCSARFVVKTEDIGENGRQVKCSKCGHKWFKEPAKKTSNTQEQAQQEQDIDSLYDIENIEKLSEFKKHDPAADEIDTSAKLEEIRQQLESDSDLFETKQSEVENNLDPENNLPTKGDLHAEPDADYNADHAQESVITQKNKPSILLKIIFTLSAILLLVMVVLNFLESQPKFLSNISNKFDYYNNDNLKLIDVSYKTRKQGDIRNVYVSGRIQNNGSKTKQVPKIRITAYSFEGKIIHEILISPSFKQIKPEEKVAFSQIMTDMPQNIDKVIVEIANSLGILQR